MPLELITVYNLDNECECMDHEYGNGYHDMGTSTGTGRGFEDGYESKEKFIMSTGMGTGTRS